MEYDMTQTPHRTPLRLLEENFRRPTGSAGRFVGHLMAVQHRTLTLWTIGHMAVRPTDRVLDVGCGGGMAVKLLTDRARDGFVAGLDYSPEMVDQAARRNATAVRRGAVEVRHGDAMDLPYEDGSFDQVCAIETFYFWPDPVRGLAQAYRVLRPGGQITIALEMSREAAAEPSLFQRYFGKRFTERSARDGLRILSGAELTGMLVEAGFQDARFDAEPRKSLGWVCARGRKS
jgi:ubiquinone/menaquinone biosynthesis C-methylase UbiE